MLEILIQTIGWIGTVLIVWAYYLVSNKKIDPVGEYYQWLNLIGALGVGVNVFHQKAWPAFTLEVIWAGIACAALLRLNKK
jgi:hypothetical protein